MFCGWNIYAQDSFIVHADSTQLAEIAKKKKEKRKKSPIRRRLEPAKVALLSAALPGAGQYYNKKLWQIKVPIIYAGGATLGLLVRDSHLRYRDARNTFDARQDDNPRTIPNIIFDNFSDERLLTEIESRKRDRDFYMVMTVLWYALNVGDAATSAQNQQRKLALGKNAYWQLKPSSNPDMLAGLSLRLRFR